MTSSASNPAIQAFVDGLGEHSQIGEVHITAHEGRFELRHVKDREETASKLSPCSIQDLREVVATDTNSSFRPLKSSPDLRRGWTAAASTEETLWEILNVIYPGAIGDWFAQKQASTKPTSYQEFVGRQSGMYRGASKLSSIETQNLVAGCCSQQHCLKKRMWTTEGEPQRDDSTITPLLCREPCQLLLELARRTSKMLQEPQVSLELPQSEATALISILKQAGDSSKPVDRIADFSSALNPRRLDLLARRIESQFPRQTEELGE